MIRVADLETMDRAQSILNFSFKSPFVTTRRFIFIKAPVALRRRPRTAGASVPSWESAEVSVGTVCAAFARERCVWRTMSVRLAGFC